MKPYLLFATPRSGSTPVYFLLLELFRQQYNQEGLLEYLNCKYQAFTDTGSGIQVEVERRVFADEDVEAETKRRLEILKKYPHRYFFKILTNFFNLNRMASLVEDYEWIFLERRDVFDQLLSHEISTTLNIWYGDALMQLKPKSLVASKKSVDNFIHQCNLYNSLKKFISPKIVLQYEDFVSQTNHIFLKNSGLTIPKKIDLSSAHRTRKQNVKDKLSLFSNQKQLIEWFKAAELSI